MVFLRSLVFNICFYAVTAGLTIGLAPLLAGPRRGAIWATRVWSRSLVWLLRHVVGLVHEVRGRERLTRSAPAIVASKHQSAWETILLPLLVPDFSVVVKQELLAIPFFGWYLRRVGMVPVDRRAGAAALRRMTRLARRAADEGRSIVVFPEGTRTAPGERRAYHRGIVALYRELGLPVVPVALNSGLFWGRRRFLKRPGRMIVEFLEPIPPGLGNEEFMAELRRRIEEASDRLAREAGA